MKHLFRLNICLTLSLIFSILLYKDLLSSLSVSQSTSDETNDEKCSWKFDHYSPSDWESYWFNNIDVLQTNVCSTLSKEEQKLKSIQLLEEISILKKTIFDASKKTRGYQDNLFSQMFYRFECSNDNFVKIVSQKIEPLIGLLRDPLTICPNMNQTIPLKFIVKEDEAMQSKRFLLLAPSAPYFNFNSRTLLAPWISQSNGRKILLDVGSSYFNGLNVINQVGTAIGARWFYEYFKVISLKFDRIIAFERAELPPRVAWAQIPDDAVSVYTLINVPVETKGKFNPLNLILDLAKPEDYVLLKLDIDDFQLERELLEQIIRNKIFHSLIDEIFFEMHVSVDVMAPFWQSTAGGELKDAYLLFSKLRQLGIRMHSWP